MTIKTVDLDTTSDVEQLLALIRDGSELLLTQDNVPLARLIPVEARIFDMHPGAIEISDDFDDPLPDELWIGSE
jgi:antitoxin (DNA-binding transcriptional repressor) of toxin-antitoxin stability system